MFNFIKNISSTEILIIIAILVILFGAKAMMKIGKTSGETVKEIKKAKREFTEAIRDDDDKPGKN